ncbi:MULTISPECIES: MerR family transcriptional regulator [Micrococcaceae]|uniref:MerR family transcriptional regulator n=1 Tax=Micrococcaceae TaxID=1268 RepID=UPI001CFFFA07|nr:MULTISPECIES: MerR family transcriptional regulator [Micrococcaceae]MCB5283692.1 HTH-type transcriptional activator TipA [Arthrobacter sp. ES1]MDJ0353981.1 MerR family transcriptional regulator [Pseudarthrobacter sp. PH31-O2]WGZ80921.1 MerR family transcriptional regulator [Arthrobacter sp. EM1]
MLETGGQSWSIGELATLCGVTVRTLHHYDQIALFPPTGRTGSGHRRYSEDDVRRLYRIRALRALGLSLEQVREVLAASPDDVGAVRRLLTSQLSALHDQAEQALRLQRQIQALLDSMGDAMPGVDHFITILEGMTMYEKYFTEEQRTELAQRRAEVGPAAVEDARTTLASLIEEGLGHVSARTPVDDPAVRDFARRWDGLGSQFHSNDATKAAARSMWQENSPELSARLPWPADRLQELVMYLQRVRDAG